MSFYPMSDGESIYVREIGHGQPVLVLSGLGMSSWHWLPFLTPYLHEFKFYIPDWRGFGRSRHCAIPKHIDAISSHWQDVQQIINKLQLEQFTLIAYSMGATTAMHGMHYADLSSRLKAYLQIDQTPMLEVNEQWPYGLFSTHQPEFKKSLNKIHALLERYPNQSDFNALSANDREQLINDWSELIKLQKSNGVAPILFDLARRYPSLQRFLLPIQRLDYLHWYVKSYLFHQEDYRTTIRDIDCPTTFFIGRHSSLYPEQGQTLVAQTAKYPHIVYFEASGHTPLITEPKKFTRQIGVFLRNQTEHQAMLNS